MLKHIQLENILFLDIETVPEEATFDLVHDEKKKLWEEKTRYQRKEDYTPEAFYHRAGIWAEFGKIICISVGYFVFKGIQRTFRVTSFYGEEATILQNFKTLLDTHYQSTNKLLCGHNIKEFDIPFIARRMLIQQITLPEKLNLFGKKPWEVAHLDTMELWKFGDYKHFTSLKLLTHVLGIPSPKDDIDGSMVYNVFYNEDNLDKIITYCEKDVIAVAQVLLRLRKDTILEDEEIVHI